MQSALIFLRDPAVWRWLLVDIGIHFTLFLLVTIHCLKTRRESTSALLWIFVAWSFPVIGALLYVFFGINRVPAKAWRKQRADSEFLAERRLRENEALPMAYWKAVHRALATHPADPQARHINAIMDRLIPRHPLLGGNSLRPLVDGDQAYPAMLAAIENASHHIHMQSFIIGCDQISRQFLDLLAAKARAGVAVRLLYDRFGSSAAVLRRVFARYRNIPNLQIEGWTQANVFKRQFQINLRNHRKILVIDGHTAFMGGLNIRGDNLSKYGRPAIRDYHVKVNGPIVQELQYSFLQDWYFMTDEDPEILLHQDYFPAVDAAGLAQARLINSGPTPDEMENMADVFFECLVSASRQVLAVTPYFVPSQDILRAFRAAAERGVDVRLLVPQKNNHRYAGLAGQAFYEELLLSGVRIFERHPPFLHAKAMLVDDKLALIGSANLDSRSLRLNYETNLLVFDDPFVNALKRIVLADFAYSTEINLREWQTRPVTRRLLENFCHLLMPVL